jgi:hypothetical protein
MTRDYAEPGLFDAIRAFVCANARANLVFQIACLNRMHASDGQEYAVARVDSPETDSALVIMKSLPQMGWQGLFLGTLVDPNVFPNDVVEKARDLWSC